MKRPDSLHSTETSSCHPDPPARAGRVIHDSRGNAVWDWALATGVLAKATTAELLQTLTHPLPRELTLAAEAHANSAGDPYNRCDW